MSEKNPITSLEKVNENEFFGIDLTPFLSGSDKQKVVSSDNNHPVVPKKKKGVSSKVIVRSDANSENSSRVRTYLAFPSSFAFKLKIICSMQNLKPSDLLVDCCSDKIDILFNKLMSSYNGK